MKVDSATLKKLLYDLPSQATLDNWHPIKVLLPPIRLQDIEFDPNESKDT